MEMRGAGHILSRQEPSRLDPCFQHLCAEWRIATNSSVSILTLPWLRLDHQRWSAATRDELFERDQAFGEHHLQGDVLVAPPAVRRGTPFPFRRNTLPVLVHFGTVIVTAPDGVGTVTLPPSTASFSEIGSST